MLFRHLILFLMATTPMAVNGQGCRKNGLKLCDGICVDLQTDPNHCGRCKRACAAYQTCEGGICIGPGCRKAGLRLCKGTCVDVMTDPNHCGNCKTVCAAGDTCESGVCTTPPPPGCTQGSQCGNAISCGPGGANCFCVTGTDGETLCAFDAGCHPCAVDEDCNAEPGGICQVSSCCPDGSCSYTRETCANPVGKRNVFSNGGKSSFDP